MCKVVRYATYKFSWSRNKSSKASLNSAGGSGRGFPVSPPKRALGQSCRKNFDFKPFEPLTHTF